MCLLKVSIRDKKRYILKGGDFCTLLPVVHVELEIQETVHLKALVPNRRD